MSDIGPQTGGNRIHSMDNLRALAMLAGVVFHSALAYSPLMHPVWPLADAGRSVAVDALSWFLHLFRMPLFFAISGFFTALLVARRGMGGLFRNRCARVLLPLLLFLPPVAIGLHWLTAHAVATTAHPSPVLAWLRAYVDGHGALPYAPGWAHLWFLFYLMLFTVLAWVASALELDRFGDRLAALPAAMSPVATPLLLASALALTGIPWPAPESLVPSLWALAFFGAYFALGYRLFGRFDLLERLRPLSPWLLIGAVAAYVALFRMTDGLTAARPAPWPRFLYAAMEAYAGFWMTLWCLLAARRWLGGHSAVMRWLADASYWVYLAHLPLLFAIQYRLLDLPMHWALKFAISTLATLALSFASYQLLVRHTLLGRLLNGKTPRARPLRESTIPPADPASSRKARVEPG
ncbi:MAG TPA: acyltransferase family protein [Pseudoxanthomonas sp.]|nr:acyltransferase family protein [Pseudoxanthomonas sp.]